MRKKRKRKERRKESYGRGNAKERGGRRGQRMDWKNEDEENKEEDGGRRGRDGVGRRGRIQGGW